MPTVREVVHAPRRTEKVWKMQEPVLENDLKRAPPEGWGFIYMISSPDGKAYIGQTRYSPIERLKSHRTNRSACPEIHSACSRYGSAMEMTIIASVRLEFLDEFEKALISAYGTIYPSGYNRTLGGGTRQGMKSPPVRKEQLNVRLPVPLIDRLEEVRLEIQPLASLRAWYQFVLESGIKELERNKHAK